MRKVVEARFHQAVFIQGIGELGRVLSSRPTTQGSKTVQVQMQTDGAGLYLHIERNGLKVEALVPSANVVIMELEPADSEPKKKQTK